MTDHFDLTAIALVTSVALLCGLALSRLRQPAIVGYIVAGVVLGPTGFGLIENADQVRVLAELGVLMLLFLVGMELSVAAFRQVYRVAVGAVLLQVGLSLLVTLSAGALLDWPWQRSVLFGFIAALSGTAVAIKMLEEIGELRSAMGRVVVGVLIAQDLAFVPLLLLTDALGPGEVPGIAVAAKLAAALALLGGLVWFLGRTREVRVPLEGWFRRNPDAVPLAALAFCFTLATLTGLLGLSHAFGSFLAGFVIGNSTARRAALRATHPIQSVLMVVFFLSVGLLIDLGHVWDNLGTVLLFVLVVTVAKTVINVGTLRLVGEPWERAFPAGVVMGQLGEFSFVLAAAGLSLAVVDADGYRLAVAVIALSWLFSPLWLVSARRFQALAAEGITSLRATLAQVYRGEIAAAEAAWRLARGAARRTAAALRRRMRRHAGDTPAGDARTGNPPAAGGTAGAPLASETPDP
ncbi:MAG TPA: cation:proton antiporter [Azospirillaceae bacterium]|nr:cation:proton antiporter [Azospirillaceae bacterium]